MQIYSVRQRYVYVMLKNEDIFERMDFPRRWFILNRQVKNVS